MRQPNLLAGILMVCAVAGCSQEKDKRIEELEFRVKRLEDIVKWLGEALNDKEDKIATPSGSEAGSQRFMDLSDAAREKFIEEMRLNRTKMMNATPEERMTYAKEVFEKVQGGDTAAKAKTKAQSPQESEVKGPK